MNDNKKIRAPKLAITRAMVEAGKGTLDALTAEVPGSAEVTDDQLVAQVFFNMWRIYWEEIEAVRRKKQPGSSLILPKGTVVPFRN